MTLRVARQGVALADDAAIPELEDRVAEAGLRQHGVDRDMALTDVPGHAEWRAAERAVVSNGVSNQAAILDG
jgi:hypothetical protein